MNDDVLPGRDVVNGKFHDEGSGIPGEHGSLFQNKAGKDDGAHPDEIGPRSHPGIFREEGSGNQGNDGSFGPAGDERGGHDSHAPVLFVLNGAGRHDSRNAAPHGNEHGNKGFPGKAEFAENAVHDERYAGHVAAILQYAQAQEQNRHLREESQNGSYAGNHAVLDQAFQPWGAAGVFQQVSYPFRNPFPEESIIGPVRAPCAYRLNGDVIYSPHDDGKNGEAQPAVGDDAINPVAARQAAGAGFNDGVVDDAGNGIIAFIGDNGFTVVIHFPFHGFNNPVDAGLFLGIERELVRDFLVSFENFNGKPFFLLIQAFSGDDFPNFSDGFFQMVRKVDGLRGPGVVRRSRRYYGVYQFTDAGPLESADFQHLATEVACKFFRVDPVAALPDNVHHVQRYNDGNAQFAKLGGEVKIAFQVAAVNQVQDEGGMVRDQVIPADDFLQGIGGKGINARKVFNDDIFMAFQAAFLFFHGDAGPVPDVLVGACQGVKERGFPAVGVARQGDGNVAHEWFPCLDIWVPVLL